MANDDLGLRYWQSQRVSRRKVIAGAAVGGATVGAIAIVGCGGGSKNGTVAGSPTAGSGSKVTDGTQDGPAKPGGILNIRQVCPCCRA